MRLAELILTNREPILAEWEAFARTIRLWTKAEGEILPEDLDDLTRFNEAIDQSLAESVTRYTANLDHSKEMFLAILGHDLRTPLSATMMSAKFMLETQELPEPAFTLATRIASSSDRMNSMVGDLLDFTRSRLGAGIPIARAEASMEGLVREVVDEMCSAHPERTILVKGEVAQRGEWDAARVTQVLANLVGNALEHGSNGGVVTITLGGTEKDATVAVHNRGQSIPADQLHGIFDPMKRREATGSGPSGNLGLGLYIAERIVTAHNGRIEVKSSEAEGTTFTVHLPRSAALH